MRTRFFRILFSLIVVLHSPPVSALDGGAPSPKAIAGTVKNLWTARKFSKLDRYIQALVAKYPDYVPAKLAAAFRDLVYLGKLPQAKQKLMLLKQDADSNPLTYSDDYRGCLESEIAMVDAEISVHAESGEANANGRVSASPSALREAVGKDVFFPPIEILSFAPAVSIPPS